MRYNTAPYNRLFKSKVVFDAAVSGIVFSSSWLQEPIEGADAILHGILAKAIWEEETKLSMSFAEQVERVLHQLVLSGTATADSISNLFGIHERTLRRRLEKEAKSLLKLINAARFELAQQLLENTSLSVTEIFKRHEIGDDERKRASDQGPFEVLAAERSLEFGRQLTGLRDDVGNRQGAPRVGTAKIPPPTLRPMPMDRVEKSAIFRFSLPRSQRRA